MERKYGIRNPERSREFSTPSHSMTKEQMAYLEHVQQPDGQLQPPVDPQDGIRHRNTEAAAMDQHPVWPWGIPEQVVPVGGCHGGRIRKHKK